ELEGDPAACHPTRRDRGEGELRALALRAERPRGRGDEAFGVEEHEEVCAASSRPAPDGVGGAASKARYGAAAWGQAPAPGDARPSARATRAFSARTPRTTAPRIPPITIATAIRRG